MRREPVFHLGWSGEKIGAIGLGFGKLGRISCQFINAPVAWRLDMGKSLLRLSRSAKKREILDRWINKHGRPGSQIDDEIPRQDDKSACAVLFWLFLGLAGSAAASPDQQKQQQENAHQRLAAISRRRLIRSSIGGWVLNSRAMLESREKSGVTINISAVLGLPCVSGALPLAAASL